VRLRRVFEILGLAIAVVGPDVRERMPILGDLSRDFDKQPQAPYVLARR